VEFLYLTYGVLFGVGASLAYTPSLVILGHYFKRYLGVVNGFVTAGSSVFTIIMPYALAFLLKTVRLEATMLCMAALIALIMACALLFKPLPGANIPPSPDNSPRLYKHSVWRRVRSVINVDIWRKKKYVIWALAVPSALFGYFVPYVHMVSYLSCIDNFSSICQFKLHLQLHIRSDRNKMEPDPEVSGLAAWSKNCKCCSSLPLGAVVSLFCESV
jgi:MCP family monocarboxylic acid transporter-like MFS transporter 10